MAGRPAPAADDDLAAWLDADERKSRPWRVDRLEFLIQAYLDAGIPDQPVFATSESMRYFQEARLCYLHGLYSATVVMCQAALETSIRATFFAAGEDESDTWGFAKLIDLSMERGLLTTNEAEELHALRKVRNPNVHRKNVMHETSQAMRLEAFNFEKDYDEILRRDAEDAVLLLMKWIHRFPFTLFENLTGRSG